MASPEESDEPRPPGAEQPPAEGGGSPAAEGEPPAAGSETEAAADAAPAEEPSAADAPTASEPAPAPSEPVSATDASSPDAPAADPPAPDAPEAPTAPAASPTAAAASKRPRRRKAGGVQERLAQDREIQRLRRRELLTGRLAKALLALAVVALGIYLARRPLMRIAARGTGPEALQAWAFDRLAEQEDPALFDLYVERFQSESDRFTPLVYRLAGRTRAPDAEGALPPDDPEAIAAHEAILLAALRHADPDRRRGGLRAFGALTEREWIRAPQLIAAVAGCLQAEDAVSRRFAAIALRRVGPTPAHHEALLRAVREDPDRQVRRFAVKALAESGDPEVGAALAKIRDGAPEVQRELFLALAKLGIQVSLERVRAIYRDFPPLRQTVVEAVGGRSEPEVAELLRAAIRDPSPGTRLAAAQALGKRGSGPGLDALTFALGDADASVRLAAVDALQARPDGARAVPALVGALRDHGGWEELRRLHAALSTLTGAEVPDPIQREEITWQRAIAGWRRVLEARSER